MQEPALGKRRMIENPELLAKEGPVAHRVLVTHTQRVCTCLAADLEWRLTRDGGRLQTCQLQSEIRDARTMGDSNSGSGPVLVGLRPSEE